MNIGNTYLIPGSRRCGFNLVEVSLAVFVLSLGLLAVFGLFPAGLGMADNARQETQATIFADYVLGGLRAAAAADRPLDVGEIVEEEEVLGEYMLVKFPVHDDDRHPTYLRYKFETGIGFSDNIRTADLRVIPGRSGGQEKLFYTEFYRFQEVQP